MVVLMLLWPRSFWTAHRGGSSARRSRALAFAQSVKEPPPRSSPAARERTPPPCLIRDRADTRGRCTVSGAADELSIQVPDAPSKLTTPRLTTLSLSRLSAQGQGSPALWSVYRSPDELVHRETKPIFGRQSRFVLNGRVLSWMRRNCRNRARFAVDGHLPPQTSSNRAG